MAGEGTVTTSFKETQQTKAYSRMITDSHLSILCFNAVPALGKGLQHHFHTVVIYWDLGIQQNYH